MTRRPVSGVLTGLLCVVVVAAACSSDPESPVEQSDDVLGEVTDVKDNWPHCSEYGALQTAIVELDAAHEAMPAAQEALDDASEEYRRLADGTDRVAIADAETALEAAREALNAAEAAVEVAQEAFLLAQSRAQSAVEVAIEDSALDEEVRYAAQAATDSYAAALDAANFAARGTALPDSQSEAYQEAVEAATSAALALSDTERAIAEAQVHNAEQRVERASTAHEAAIAAIAQREDAVRSAEDLVRDRTSEAGEVTAVVESEMAERIEAIRAEALAPLQAQLLRLELISRLVANPLRTGDWVTFAAVKKDVVDIFRGAGGSSSAADAGGDYSALLVAWDAHVAAYGALSQRLQLLADEAGLPAEVLASYASLLDGRTEAWADAIELDWVDEVFWSYYTSDIGYGDSTLRTVLADQDAYDDLTYEQLVRYARTSIADLVPVDESVSAADAEELAWSATSQVRASFETAARALDEERSTAITENRLHNLGNPTLDNIAWRGFEATLDALSVAAQEKIRAIQAEGADIGRSNEAELPSMVESDSRVIAAREAMSQADAALSSELDRLSSSRQQASTARSELGAAEAELRQANASVQASRPPFDRAVLATWLAVGAAAGCR